MREITLKAEIRKEIKRGIEKLRKEDRIPAIFYGSKIKPIPLSVDYSEFSHIYKKVGESEILSLVINNKKRDALIKEVQLDPITSKYIHIDFYQVRKGEEIKTRVPLKFIGESKAVKELSGILEKPLEEIEVECLPKDLPHEIKVDISSLETFDDVIRIKDLKIPPQVKVLEDKNETVALVSPPRKEEEIEELEKEVEEKVEEVEGVKKEEEVAEEVEGARGKEGMPPKTREVPPHEKPETESKGK